MKVIEHQSTILQGRMGKCEDEERDAKINKKVYNKEDPKGWKVSIAFWITTIEVSKLNFFSSGTSMNRFEGGNCYT